jgi:hypothetical protein
VTDPHPQVAILSADTSREAEDMQVRQWRAMSSVEKARLITSLCRMADAMAIAGLRQRHPAATERECFLRFAALKLGRELAERVYPELATLRD